MPYRPKFPLVATLDDGTETVIGPDQIFADDHPFVRKYLPAGAMVDIAADEIIQAPGSTYAQSVVEQATAAPGEERDVPVKRGPGRPRKS